MDNRSEHKTEPCSTLLRHGEAFDPPAGPHWISGLAPLETHTLGYDKPLCASLDGFTLHAATRAGAADLFGREALRRYVLRPPLAQERLEQRPDGLVRTILKKAYRDGTAAVCEPTSASGPAGHSYQALIVARRGCFVATRTDRLLLRNPFEYAIFQAVF